MTKWGKPKDDPPHQDASSSRSHKNFPHFQAFSNEISDNVGVNDNHDNNEWGRKVNQEKTVDFTHHQV